MFGLRGTGDRLAALERAVRKLEQAERARGAALDRQLSQLADHAAGQPTAKDLRELRQALHIFKGTPLFRRPDGDVEPIHYAVLCSEHRSYFNLGGDLRHFRQCLRKRDSDSLRKYSMLSLDVMLEWTSCARQNITTVALVQGKAQGGGFETALGAASMAIGAWVALRASIGP